jgi:leucyl aminopeptidase
MNISFLLQPTAKKNQATCIVGNRVPTTLKITSKAAKALNAKPSKWRKLQFHTDDGSCYIRIPLPENKDNRAEYFRKLGVEVYAVLKNSDLDSCFLSGQNSDDLINLAEGLALKDYRFEKYKKDPCAFVLKSIAFDKSKISSEEADLLVSKLKAIYLSRDLVNEPANILTAVELANRIKTAGKDFGFKVEVFGKKKIQSLRMGGLLAVNQGSTKEPTFSILDYTPEKNSKVKTVVFVGKGIVYDTGGLSLKPTPNSMDIMKCDMGGAAAVIGAVCSAAALKLPLRVIGLIPATDNQPGPDAYQPGDVITMFDGTTVEVMNTDAEGRLAMADALAYAKRYNPDLALDLATLTGSSMRALGRKSAATMGTAPAKVMDQLKDAGLKSYERVVEFPLWDEYAEDLHSEIADTKNLGPTPFADVIIAGKFLEKFTDYPWIHIDIAGPAFLSAPNGYLPSGATGFGVNLLYHFLKDLKL